MLADGIRPHPVLPHPALERTSALTRRLLAPNPGPMTLDGTNSYLVAAPGTVASVVVDPGPLDEPHLARLAAAGPVALVLITHHHADHTAGSARFAKLTGAPVRALDPVYCVGGDPLRGGELIEAAGVSIRVMETPGHTADSVCFHLAGDGALGPKNRFGSVLTGDTVLGRGTTVVGHPDGTLREYLASLETLRALGPATVLPAHGPVLPDLAAICAAYLAHRHERLDQVGRALTELGPTATLTQVTDLVYAETDAAVRVAAEASVRAQLAYLRS